MYEIADFRKYFLVHVLSDNVFQRTRDIPFQLGVGNDRDMLSPDNDGVASF
jgi:hypothetical protein